MSVMSFQKKIDSGVVVVRSIHFLGICFNVVNFAKPLVQYPGRYLLRTYYCVQSTGFLRFLPVPGKHPISALVELCNKRRWMPPDFIIVQESGPDHKKHFIMKVSVVPSRSSSYR